MRPRVSFRSRNIWDRLRSCELVARAHRWHPNDILHFRQEVSSAFSWEEAMAVVEREFDVVR